MLWNFSSVKPVELKCEYKNIATGIDILQPRFSWLTEYDDHNSFQSAYRIIVSTSINSLKQGQGNIWDSRKVYSSDSHLILFSGNKLCSNRSYFWQVIIWNEKDEPSSWSEPAEFSTGFIKPDEWKAAWISHIYAQNEDTHIHFVPGIDKWIWHPLSNNEDRYNSVILIKSFVLSKIEKIESANLIVTADEKFCLWINNTFITESDHKIFSWTRPVSIEVKHILKEGCNRIRVKGANSYVDVPGCMLRLEIKYTSGKLEIINSDSSWKSSFESDLDNIVDAKVVRLAGDKPYHLCESGLKFNPAAYFKKHFKTYKKIVRAFVNCSALGIYNLQINGTPVTEARFLPGWSDFNKRVYYNSYEVTSILAELHNHTINVILADGYYSGYCGWEKGRGYYGKYPALKLQLNILYDDGSEEVIFTDERWTSSEGPIREADILMGEFYDSDYQINNFKKVRVISGINPVLTANKADEVKVREEFKPHSIKKINENAYIIDFEQNFAGFVRLYLKNAGKRKIILRFSEVLNDDGSLYIENLRMARAQDTFISKGDDEETWEPLFTYHGFRYVEVTGLENINENTIIGISINSLPQETSTFNSSNQKLNKLFECIRWNQKSNYVDIPTDCPQRDERFGWTGDALSYFRTASFNHDVSGFYRKWLENLFDAQKKEGHLPPFAPLAPMGVGPIYFNSAGWADAGIITPFQFYEFYNDIEILTKYYERMKLFINSLREQSSNLIIPGFGYGDWLCNDEETSKSFIGTAYFAYDVFIMEKIASVLGRNEDSIFYSELFIKIKNSFREKFLSEEGILNHFTQTAAVLAIYFNLLEADEKDRIISYLIKDIINNNYHITTGFLGLSFFMPVLSSFDRNDIAWKVITNNEFPSWFYMIDHGATTLWERWDSYHPEKGFYDPTMNSFNHCSLGTIGEWFFTGIAGINLIEPGFKRISIKPYMAETLDYSEVSFKTIYGTIQLVWRKKKTEIVMNIKIPFNTDAVIVIPSYTFYLNSDYKIIKKENNCTHIEVGSGSYEFKFNWKKHE